MNNFQPKRGQRDNLTAQELETLDAKVLPTAQRWMAEYPEGSNMHNHAKQTREYWGDFRGRT